MSTDNHSGLEEVSSIPSAITSIEGTELRYRGIPIQELTENSTFEEVTYLLWYGRLPGKLELDNFLHDLKDFQNYPEELHDILHLIPRQAHPQSALRTLVSAAGLFDHDESDLSIDARHRCYVRILTHVPSFVAAFERFRRAKSPVSPDPNLGFAENFLYMLWGEKPDPVSAEALEKALILYADHEMNASTFAARVATGTMADVYSAIVSGIATLKGNLHGGANQEAMRMILDIGSADMAEEAIDEILSKGQKVMGFGHPVYKQGDPRVPPLKEMSEKLCETRGCSPYFHVAEKVEEIMFERKKLRPNIDFYSGIVFYALGLPIDLFTPVFTIARVSGWVAHIKEQFKNNKLIRPRAEYIGVSEAHYIPLDERK